MIAVVIPCYRVKSHILSVIQRISSPVERIYVVDDQCPEQTGKYVESHCTDSRVRVLYNPVNKGVGGAVITGYKQAIEDSVRIVIKIDGDGQMDPALIPKFIQPLLEKTADYTKGNRFYRVDFLSDMPFIRLVGNSALSFINKVQSGYWSIMDPTNGYTAIHVDVLRLIPLDRLEERYFFESDMLFRLNTVRAVVRDVPMRAIYGDEKSSLRVGQILISFPPKYLERIIKRIFYNYFLRDFNAGSVELLMGIPLFLGGVIFGIFHWIEAYKTHIPAATGTIMLASLPTILGFQLLLAFLQTDVANTPNTPISS